MKDGEADDPDTKRKCSDYTREMESYIGNYSAATLKSHQAYGSDHYENIFDDDELDDEDILPQELDQEGNPVFRPDAEEFLPTDPPYAENSDEHIGMEINLPYKGELRRGRIMRRKRNESGALIGTANENPIMDTRVYEVDFGEGTYQDYTTNLIMENLYSQVDEIGQQYSILKGIVDAKSDETAVKKEDGWITMPNNLRRRKITTRGWKLKVQWEDGSESWVPLRILKESNPVETAEFAVAKGIEREPAFAWWTGSVLKKRNYFIKKLRKSKVMKSNLKFGLVVPKTVDEALAIDMKNGNSYWNDAIKKELKNVIVAFQLLGEEEAIIKENSLPHNFRHQV